MNLAARPPHILTDGHGLKVGAAHAIARVAEVVERQVAGDGAVFEFVGKAMGADRLPVLVPEDAIPTAEAAGVKPALTEVGANLGHEPATPIDLRPEPIFGTWAGATGVSMPLHSGPVDSAVTARPRWVGALLDGTPRSFGAIRASLDRLPAERVSVVSPAVVVAAAPSARARGAIAAADRTNISRTVLTNAADSLRHVSGLLVRRKCNTNMNTNLATQAA